ncbi:MAG: 2-succinyl-5-enolpyruvyl-6-hydroxy-3-cyclohexene-1-carboxylic-acid synthase [Bacteroidales bacterium]|nr:2-succinyl-5-enolpyruvyl-6-hydroxy-3-cyclohexene-1-carboxylic-acid synthase [Bacteroidales bacterium]MDT8432042.1 2-succinyl-5-enolpyruvyl-6-hydroxy-3-cyclohexene-1-carboxylic-acid synthase [Bacteroidales bacterium]
MTKLPFKQHIADLAELLKQLGIQHVVICPGSRNAPMIQVFQREAHFKCFSIVDERSAGYIALGMAAETRRPVVVITTSGTAVLNLAPAVAEAYNQHIPLIILTGDRPAETPPQFTNQRINQQNVFGPNANGFYEFPPDFTDQAHLEKVMHEAAGVIRSGCIDRQGPVHLNLVLHEPLYREIPLKTMTRFDSLNNPPPLPGNGFNTSERALFSEYLRAQKKVLILAGMAFYGASARNTLEALAQRFQVAIVAENIANLNDPAMVSAPELVLASATTRELQELTPDLVIAMGGPVVSKRTRLFVQGLESVPVVILNGTPERSLPGIRELTADNEDGTDLAHLGTKDPPTGSKRGLPGTENMSADNKDESAGNKNESAENNNVRQGTGNNYGKLWKEIETRTAEKAGSFLLTAPFSNITALSKIMKRVPAHTIVHVGNSGTIRYAQLEPARADLTFQSNRGTSGIDGSLSTAVGTAMVSEKQHLAVLGDLSFMYDSNALWNRNFPSNLKIIVLNDKGGGIFRLLDGPDRMPFFDEFSVAGHPVALEHMAKAFGMNFLYANDDYTLGSCLDTLFATGAEKTLLDVDTSGSENSGIFKKFYTSIKQQ